MVHTLYHHETAWSNRGLTQLPLDGASVGAGPGGIAREQGGAYEQTGRCERLFARVGLEKQCKFLARFPSCPDAAARLILLWCVRHWVCCPRFTSPCCSPGSHPDAKHLHPLVGQQPARLDLEQAAFCLPPTFLLLELLLLSSPPYSVLVRDEAPWHGERGKAKNRKFQEEMLHLPAAPASRCRA